MAGGKYAKQVFEQESAVQLNGTLFVPVWEKVFVYISFYVLPEHQPSPPVLRSTHWMNFSLGTTILLPIFTTGKFDLCINS